MSEQLRKAQLYELIVELQRRGLHVYNPDEMRLAEITEQDEAADDGGYCTCFGPCRHPVRHLKGVKPS